MSTSPTDPPLTHLGDVLWRIEQACPVSVGLLAHEESLAHAVALLGVEVVPAARLDDRPRIPADRVDDVVREAVAWLMAEEQSDRRLVDVLRARQRTASTADPRTRETARLIDRFQTVRRERDEARDLLAAVTSALQAITAGLETAGE